MVEKDNVNLWSSYLCVYTQANKYVYIHGHTKTTKKEGNTQEQYLEGESLVHRQKRILKQCQDSAHSAPSIIFMPPPTPYRKPGQQAAADPTSADLASTSLTVPLPRRCANSESQGRAAGSGTLWLRYWAGDRQRVLHEDTIQKAPLTQKTGIETATLCGQKSHSTALKRQNVRMRGS